MGQASGLPGAELAPVPAGPRGAAARLVVAHVVARDAVVRAAECLTCRGNGGTAVGECQDCHGAGYRISADDVLRGLDAVYAATRIRIPGMTPPFALEVTHENAGPTRERIEAAFLAALRRPS